MLHKLLVLLAIGCASAQTSIQCNEKTFTTCQHAFTDTLGIDRTYDWTNPAALLTAIQNIYINDYQGQSGLIAVCNAYNALVKCLNQANILPDKCLSAQWLLHSDTTPENAYPYAMLMKQIRWQCSAGFYPAYDQWTCIKSVYKNYNSSLIQCVRDFRLNAAESAPYEKCRFASKGMTCYKQPFMNTCHNGGVENYGCESFRQYVLAEYPQCTEYCEVRVV